jgi:hypothetical protein
MPATGVSQLGHFTQRPDGIRRLARRDGSVYSNCLLDHWSNLMSKRSTQPLLVGSEGNVCLPSPVPVGSPPFSEERLQGILQTHADILPINQFDPIFRPLCCIGREVPTNAGPIDLLFISSTGYITVVETKLWKSSDARRKVVAQIIDYAKELVHWDYDTLEEKFRRYANSIGESESTLYEYVCQETEEYSDEVDFQDTVNR